MSNSDKPESWKALNKQRSHDELKEEMYIAEKVSCISAAIMMVFSLAIKLVIFCILVRAAFELWKIYGEK